MPAREAFPMVLVANKVDLVHLRKITSEQGHEMAAKHNVSVSLVCSPRQKIQSRPRGVGRSGERFMGRRWEGEKLLCAGKQNAESAFCCKV